MNAAMHKRTKIGCEKLIQDAINGCTVPAIQSYIKRNYMKNTQQWALWARQHSPLLLQVTSTNPLESYHSELKRLTSSSHGLIGMSTSFHSFIYFHLFLLTHSFLSFVSLFILSFLFPAFYLFCSSPFSFIFVLHFSSPSLSFDHLFQVPYITPLILIAKRDLIPKVQHLISVPKKYLSMVWIMISSRKSTNSLTHFNNFLLRRLVL